MAHRKARRAQHPRTATPARPVHRALQRAPPPPKQRRRHPRQPIPRHPESAPRITPRRALPNPLRPRRHQRQDEPAPRRPHAPPRHRLPTPNKRVLALIDETTVTVIHLDTGEILSEHHIDPDNSYWRNTKKARADGPRLPRSDTCPDSDETYVPTHHTVPLEGLDAPPEPPPRRGRADTDVTARARRDGLRGRGPPGFEVPPTGTEDSEASPSTAEDAVSARGETSKSSVPLEGLEPPTVSLGRNCSSIELQRLAARVYPARGEMAAPRASVAPFDRLRERMGSGTGGASEGAPTPQAPGTRPTAARPAPRRAPARWCRAEPSGGCAGTSPSRRGCGRSSGCCT